MRTIGDLKGAEYIDSRDIIEVADSIRADVECDDPRELTDDEAALLVFVVDEAGYIEDWEYGATLVHERYFEDYARELADDCGMIPDGTGWPMNCIDWEQAARELAHDYSLVEFLGDHYYVRS